MILKIFGFRQQGFQYETLIAWLDMNPRYFLFKVLTEKFSKPSSAFVYHDSRQREENQILPLGHFEWFRYKSPTSLRLSS